MNTSGDRLKTLLLECNLSPSDFALQRKVTPQHVNNWFRRGVPLARLDEIADLLCVCSKWLRTGEGPKHPTPMPRLNAALRAPGPAPVEPSLLAAHSADDIQLPFYAMQSRQLSPLANSYLRLPARALSAVGVDPAKALCLTMPANNMSPLLPRGSPLAIDCGMTTIVEGELYAVLHNGRVRVHSLSLRRNGALRLHSHDSDEHPTETYTAAQRKTQKLSVLGWVFWWGHLRSNRPS
ncbi:MAG: LexA family transcriptional regulator [Pseudomonas sp.]